MNCDDWKRKRKNVFLFVFFCFNLNKIKIIWYKNEFNTRNKEQIKKMKRILSIFMSLVLLLGVCVVGAGGDPNKETEAEYKARIKKEVYDVPVESTEYKLVEVSEISEAYNTVTNIQIGEDKYYLKGESYNSTLYYEDIVSFYRNDEKLGEININYKDEYKEFGGISSLIYFDNNFFIIRDRFGRNMFRVFYDICLPPTLFLYDIDNNSLVYMGYYENWFTNKMSSHKCYLCNVGKA